MRTLKAPAGYDPLRSPVVSAAAAQLDTLLSSLRGRLRESSVSELEWQLRPGVNTIGMLLAHLAIAEAHWVAMFTGGIGSGDAADHLVREVLGIGMEGDGMPLPRHGIHPPALARKTVDHYFALLDRARAATHRLLGGWDDEDLEQTADVDGVEISRAWMIYHLVEHFAHHRGQIAQLQSLRNSSP